jgi:predicted ATPase
VIIEGVEAEGIFSFGAGDEGLSVDLNEVLTVIVGPNASGKTNLIRILDVVRTVVRFQDPKQENRGALAERLDRFVSVALRGSAWAPEAARVRVRVAFTHPDEKAMLAAFIRAVLFAALLDGQVPDDRTIADLEAWVASEVTTDKLVSLFRGAILVSHTGVLGTPWRLAYEFTHRETPFIWQLATALPNRADVIEPQRHMSMELTSFPSLAQRVFGVGWGSQSGLPRPPEKSFMLDTLLTTGDDAVKVQMPSPSLTHLPAPWREFAALARPWISDEYLSPQQPVIVLASVLSVLLARGLSYLGPAGEFTPSVGLAWNHTGGASASLAERLYRLKNGSRTEQQRYGEIETLFAELAEGRRFEVRHIERRGGDDEVPTAEIEVSPRDARDYSEAVRPLSLAGTGVEQALHLAEALVNDEAVLLVDEPATNLHPSWQRVVRTHLQRRQGQSVLVTHSPYLVPAETEEQLATIVRFSAPRGVTVVHRLPSEDLEAREWVQRITKELAWSADARGLLFANGVVLLEGETELGALPTWFAKSTPAAERGSPEDRHVAFYSVGGDHGFGAFVRYLDRFGVPWAIVCDGAAFRIDGHHIFEQVVGAGGDGEHTRELQAYLDRARRDAPSPDDMTPELFDEGVALARRHGIFTLASGWHTKPRRRARSSEQDEGELPEDDESFEAFIASKAELAAVWAQARHTSPKSKPRAGRLLADATDCPAEVADLYTDLLDYLEAHGL